VSISWIFVSFESFVFFVKERADRRARRVVVSSCRRLVVSS